MDCAGIDAEVADRAEAIDGRLEDESGGRTGRVAGELRLVSAALIGRRDYPLLGRGRQALHDRVEQRLDALVGGRRAAEGRHERAGADGRLERGLQLMVADRLVTEVFFDQR